MPAAQVGLPARAGLGRGVRLPGRLHLRGHRPDPGLVLLAAGRQHPGLRREPLPPRAVPRATSSTPTAARCPSRSATSSTPGRSSTPGAPTPCAGGCSRQGSPWTPTRASFGAIDTAMRDMLLTLWNTFSFFTTYASLNEFDPADPAIPAPARARRRSTAGSCRAWPARRPTVTEALDGYEPLRGGHRPGRPRRRPLQLVRAPQPAPLLAHRPRRAARRLPGGAGDAARGADDAGAAARAVLPVRGRHHVART